MEKKFTSVFNGAGKIALSLGSLISSLLIQFPVWLVVIFTVLPYVVAMVMYFILWILNEISVEKKHSRDLEMLSTKQAHELQMLKAKKNTH